MLGRTVGLAYVLPLTYFMLRKRLPKELYGRFAVLLSLGAAQGGIGWWMVRSGLEEHGHEQLAKRSEVRVSPYRLATHVRCFESRFIAASETDVRFSRSSALLSRRLACSCGRAFRF
jgi:heme A synthase